MHDEQKHITDCHTTYLAYIQTGAMIFNRLFIEQALKCGVFPANIAVLCKWLEILPVYDPDNQPFHPSSESVYISSSFTSDMCYNSTFVGSHILHF